MKKLKSWLVSEGYSDEGFIADIKVLVYGVMTTVYVIFCAFFIATVLTSCSIPKGLIEHSDVIDEEGYYKRYGNTYLQAVPVKIGDEFFAIPLPPGVHVDPKKIEVK